MSTAVSQLSPELFFSSKVSKTDKGATLVWLSSRPEGGPDDKYTIMLSETEVDPTDDAQVAMLPEAPFGWNPLDPQSTTKKLTVELTPPLAVFFEKLDSFCKTAAVDHAEEWFKKPMQYADVERVYKPLVRMPKEDRYPPTIGIKVNTDGPRATKILVAQEKQPGEEACSYYEGTVNDIKPKTKCLVVCEASQLWIVRGEWGITLTATEITTWVPSSRKRGVSAFGGLFESKMKRVTREEEEAPLDDEVA